MTDTPEPSDLDFDETGRRHPREVYRLVRRFVDDPEEALNITRAS